MCCVQQNEIFLFCCCRCFYLCLSRGPFDGVRKECVELKKRVCIWSPTCYFILYFIIIIIIIQLVHSALLYYYFYGVLFFLLLLAILFGFHFGLPYTNMKHDCSILCLSAQRNSMRYLRDCLGCETIVWLCELHFYFNFFLCWQCKKLRLFKISLLKIIIFGPILTFIHF